MVKLRGKALLVLLAAVLCLGLGATACGGQDSSTATGESATVTNPTSGRPRPPLVSVYAARTSIAKGTSGDAATARGQIEIARIPKPFKPESAITSPDQLAGKVAFFDIPAHSVLVAGMFVDPPGPTGSP